MRKRRRIKFLELNVNNYRNFILDGVEISNQLNSKLFMFEVVNHHNRHLLALHSHVVMHRNTKNHFIMWKCFPLHADSPGSLNRTSPSPHFFVAATNVLRMPLRTAFVSDRWDAMNALPWSPVCRRPRMTKSLVTDHSRCVIMIVLTVWHTRYMKDPQESVATCH